MSDFLTIAKQAYDQSTIYMDNNYRAKWEDDLRHFQSKHRAGSKYNKPQFQYRSKLFRPKTRSAIRSNEAAASAAFFSNQDVASIEAQHPEDKQQQASAEIMQELLQYRLTKSIPWFLTCMGAFQDASVVGVVCSEQYWEFEYKENDGQIEVIKDQPCVELIPVEQLRIHPAANWIDPVGTSPYIIKMIPMYVKDIKKRMESVDPKTGEPKWNLLSDDQLRTANRLNFDSTRQARSGDREDPADQNGKEKPLSDFDVVWVHKNFINIEGMDVIYYTLGTDQLLSDPKPLKELYFTGERPFAMGIVVLESHKLYPDSPVQLGVPVQSELNENANQRADNVKLVMNKRYTVKRGSNIDLKNLMRNVAGGATVVNEHTDVAEREFTDVTGSSYMEQDRLNLDFDDIVGTFSGSSVQSNRKMNETVGGMAMLRGGANALIEYQIKTFSETWVEPVMRQLIKLEQHYETDSVVLGIAAAKAKLFQKYGVDQITDELLNQELTLNVNVGMGATDPILKVERFTSAIGKMAQVAQAAAQSPALQRLNLDECFKEIFGRLGYKDGSRFIIDTENPEMAQIMSQIEQMQGVIQKLQAALEDKEAEREAKKELELIKEEAADDRLEKELDNKLVLEHIKGKNNGS